MTALMHAHSGLRFVILLVGVVSLVVFGLGLAQKKPFEKLHRILGASFAGSLHLQLLLGVVAVSMMPWQPRYIGHIVMMVAAAGVAQAAMTINRKRAAPGLQLPLLGVAGALACILIGVLALGHGVMPMVWLGARS